MIEQSRLDQTLRANYATVECATHKDASLTLGDSPPAPPILDRRSGLFLDVDGTLLEIAPRPDLVRVPAELPRLIARLAEQRHGALALISGRPLTELDGFFQPWRGAAAGLHGIERRRADGVLDGVVDSDSAAALARIRPRLVALAGGQNGLILEDKGRTLALHYRAVPEREAEIRAFAEGLERETGTALRLVPGKMVVELQPRNANKGLAIAAFLAEPPFVGRNPIFVGDDTTDEDGFIEIRRRGGVAVKVGKPGKTAANYSLPSVTAVLEWLARTALS
jgi:trehalose 6-phosphate phosphatase